MHLFQDLKIVSLLLVLSFWEWEKELLKVRNICNISGWAAWVCEVWPHPVWCTMQWGWHSQKKPGYLVKVDPEPRHQFTWVTVLLLLCPFRMFGFCFQYSLTNIYLALQLIPFFSLPLTAGVVGYLSIYVAWICKT